MVQAEAERYVARHEGSMAKLDAEAVRSAWVQLESELARVQHALVASKDAQ